MEYEAIIGLEVHAQLLTRTKMFCSCSSEYGAPPNTNTCPVCLGLPGALPVVNREAVSLAIKAALALNLKINEYSRFDRKNYFYPDLPKGYQITQYEYPLAENGYIEVPDDERYPGGSATKIRIKRLHLEEDAGKLIHPGQAAIDEVEFSYVDFNRCGVPLIEIVSEPDIRSPAQAAAYMKTLRQILRYIGVCEGNLEEGNMRCDANVSVRPKGSREFGVRTEVKNINSFRFVEKALAYEIKRHIELIESGKEVVHETRLWDSQTQTTRSMRGKEEEHDYRYFPEPDLVPLIVDKDWIERVKGQMPELPRQRAIRFQEQYGLPEYDAGVLTAEKEIADYFEEAAKLHRDPKAVSNWVMTEVLRIVKEEDADIRRFPVTPQKLASMLDLIASGKISKTMGKEVFAEMYKTGKDPDRIVEEKGLSKITDTALLEAEIDKVLAANPQQVEKYKAGKTKLLGFFVGQVMKATKGKADPKLVNEILKKKLSK